MLKSDRLTSSKYRYLLFPLALFYWGVIFWRNLFYKIGFFVSKKLPCTVISIGNLTVGGTGKTPAVIYLASLLKENGEKVAVLSRGYGRKSTGTVLVADGDSSPTNWNEAGDEPALMAQKLPGVPIVADEDRYRGGTYLLNRFNPDYIILDDAFQHRSLDRDLDIVLINAGDRPQDHKLLPYGILREPVNQLNRADVLLLTKSNIHKQNPILKNKLGKLNVPFFKSEIQINEELLGIQSGNISVGEIKGKDIIAVSAVGDPTGFIKTLDGTRTSIVDHLKYPDHHTYTDTDIQDMQKALTKTSAELILTTEKDFIKLKELNISNLPVYALPVRFQPEDQGEDFILQTLGLT